MKRLFPVVVLSVLMLVTSANAADLDKGRETKTKIEKVWFQTKRISEAKNGTTRPRFLKTKDAFFVTYLECAKLFAKLTFRAYLKNGDILPPMILEQDQTPIGSRLQLIHYDVTTSQTPKTTEGIYILHSSCTITEGIAPRLILSQLRRKRTGHFEWAEKADVVAHKLFQRLPQQGGILSPVALRLGHIPNKKSHLIGVFHSLTNVWFSESRDGGVNWSRPKVIANNVGGSSIALHRTEKPKRAFYVFYSTGQATIRLIRREDGKQCSKSQSISIPGDWKRKIVEFAVTSDKQGNLWMAFSALNQINECSIYITRSKGDGTKWTKPQPLTVNSQNDRQPAITLQYGKILVAFRRGRGRRTQVWLATCPVEKLKFSSEE